MPHSDTLTPIIRMNVVREIKDLVAKHLEKAVMYDDEEVMVIKSPTFEEWAIIIYDVFSKIGKNISFTELAVALEGYIGSERLRKIIANLLARNMIMEYPDGTLGTPDAVYIPFKAFRKQRRRRSRVLSRSFSILDSIRKEMGVSYGLHLL